MSLVPNRPSAEGRALGRELARFCDQAEAETLKRFPNAKPRCASCAFQLGTVPNGCLATVKDAFKCVMEHRPFMCHEVPHGTEPDQLCGGYAAMMTNAPPPRKAPWPFDHEVEHACNINEEIT